MFLRQIYDEKHAQTHIPLDSSNESCRYRPTSKPAPAVRSLTKYASVERRRTQSRGPASEEKPGAHVHAGSLGTLRHRNRCGVQPFEKR